MAAVVRLKDGRTFRSYSSTRFNRVRSREGAPLSGTRKVSVTAGLDQFQMAGMSTERSKRKLGSSARASARKTLLFPALFGPAIAFIPSPSSRTNDSFAS